MLFQLVKTFIFNHCDKHVKLLTCMEIQAHMLFQLQVLNTLLISRWPSASFMHRQCRPWSKLTRKHVMFWWRPSIDFDGSKFTRRETWAQNLNLDTYHSWKHVKFWRAARHMFRCPGNPSPPNISPSKYVMCFGPMHPSSTFPMQSPSMPHDRSMTL
jgi:hypothetical protein